MAVSERVTMPNGGRLTILDRVGLRLDPGEAVAILGSSGSGKSTLLGLLAGLDQASEGEIRLFGHDLGALDEDARARLRAGRVSFVFQSFQLLPGMTALENTMLPLELAHDRSARSGAERALAHVGLSARLHHYPSQLSGGEQQRVALARAFAARPGLLFADEPTGSLDRETGVRITELLFTLREETGTALLLVTHDEQLAARCDRRLLMEAGRLGAQP
ncbi:MAG: ABC transporter [Candidatus Sedimenticola endophacoides]|uniref:ABC transporter n=1 Tax=Candidatus Sedimenticola endophacoides TaxID=2548426 RepID=A0A6N4DNC7_9GAMM|nr:MAG: ABC transporter [Candidatus Sedimenticola endophacoides]OQX37455.1 MAG: ABC transporter [Candidatus Sedimenticola endophacoides]OQX39163.1 MAG: ABC transporter [Candidatus Sedimenticola endophacoides]PUD98467.1 MAG: ABC transporter [Candidatus Sedimenticola endophacoides]PUD98475.1 MAG: ABC transporter [Candidatus Sedimenticola endophacoides]